MKRSCSSLFLILGLAAFAAPAFAAVAHNANVTPDAIWGAGNGNGYFTVQTKGGLQLALRAKQRFPTPQDTATNGNSNGAFFFPAGNACPGFGFAPAPFCEGTPTWNIDWSVNTDATGNTGLTVSAYKYLISFDSNPAGSGKTWTQFDPITPSLHIPFWDHSFGDNSTANGAGEEVAGTNVEKVDNYQTLLDTKNVVQNSWNYEFFNNPGTNLTSFNPAVPGTYNIVLRALNKTTGADVATVTIRVVVGS